LWGVEGFILKIRVCLHRETAGQANPPFYHTNRSG
jgi:hypothetical protein